MTEAASKKPEILLDLSRLLSRIAHATPTGVDRCEMAYARGLLAKAPDRLAFAAVHPIGFYGRLPKPAVLRFLDLTEERWAARGFSSPWDKRRFVASTLAALRPRPHITDGSEGRPRIYLQASPSNLTNAKLMRRILAKERAKFACLVHDLIPLEFPEYGRADGVEKHRKRIRTIADLADGIICNSHATLASLTPWLERAPHSRDVVVAHLGTIAPRKQFVGQTCPNAPFACVGTIEPRKNHLLLLNLWRNFAKDEAPPRLIIIGRRGWENEQVVDMLERCEALRGHVEERNGMSDNEVNQVLSRSRALLMPSFAEGYGMPVAEALALGTPVICSDLPALREAGSDVPDYLDPLDGPAWRRVIIDYHRLDGTLRAKQLERLQHWSHPTWESHMDTVIDMIERVAR